MTGFIEFISDYLPMYNPVRFKESFLDKLIPYYSLSGSMYRIGWGDRNKAENLEPNTIHVEDFVLNIENALIKFLQDLNDGSFEIQSYIQRNHVIIQDKSNS